MNNLVIFDCDGVLVDSEFLANQALVDCLTDIGISMVVEDAVRKFKGRKLADCLIEIEIANKCAASNGPLQKTQRNLEIAGLIHHFGKNIFSAYTIQKWKPEPELFLHACKEMGFQPANCVVVEDSEPGIHAALAGGFRVLAFGVDSIQHRDVTPFQHMSELPSLIQGIMPVG